MSVATKNPFALLDEDGSRPASPPPKPTQDAPAPATAARGNAPKARGGPASRGGKYYPRGGARPAQTGEGNLNTEGVQEPAGERKFDIRGRGRGGARTGNRGARGGRPFDRHSQTGKTDSTKKVHQGWGGDDGPTELKQEEAAATDAVADWGSPAPDAAEWGTPSADAPATPIDKPADDKPARRERGDRGDREREAEEEDNTLTFEQYLAQKKAAELEGVSKLEARKVEADWNDAVLLEKPEEEEAYFAAKAKPTGKPKSKKEEKVFLEIDARFERPQTGTRGRGRGRGEGRGGESRGRGEGRGRGGGRGGPRGTAPSATVNVDDEAAFPSLA